MNRFIVGAATMLLLAALTYLNAEDVKTFRGEISDSQCALNVHSLTRSHQEMLKSKSMGGTPAECSLYCVQHMGGHFVLAAKNDVYHLQNQELATNVQSIANNLAVTTSNLNRLGLWGILWSHKPAPTNTPSSGHRHD